MNMVTQLRIEATANIEAAADGAAYPTVSMVAYGGGAIRVSGYRHPVVIDLDGVDGLGRAMPLLMQHDHGRIVGHGTAERNGNQLNISGVVGASNGDAEQVVSLAKSGFPWRASVGADVSKVEEIKSGKSVVVNGATHVGPLTIARKSFLYETSFTAVPADSSTSATVAASKPKKGMNMEFAQYVEASGFDLDSLSETQQGVLRAAYDSQRKNDSVSPAVSVDAVIQAAKAKENRQQEYGRIVASAIERGMDTNTAEKLVQAACKDDLSATEFELQVLRAQRHTGSTHVATNGGESPLVVECALARQLGLEAEYKPEVIEASERQFKHGLGLVELLQMSARRNGQSNVSSKDVKGLLQAAFAPVRASGPSSYDLSGVLSNLANKSARAGYMSVEAEWRKVAAVSSVNDLKPYKSYALTGDMTFKKVGNGGELTHGDMGEEVYTNQAETFGRMFSVTRADILNDSLGVFNQVRLMLGRGAALAINKEVWTEFLSNLALWSTDNANYLSGAGSVLDVDSLSSAVTLFDSQTDPKGEPMGLTGKVLVVPPALKVQANKLVKDTEIRINGASSKTTYTTANPHAGMFEVAASAYLNNSTIPNGSATHWWLLADPLEYPTIEVAFLNGKQVPAIETADADFNTLGIQMRAYFDFGSALQGHRGSVRSAGV